MVDQGKSTRYNNTMMNLYRIVLNAEDEVKAETALDAWGIFKKNMDHGVYGPTIADVELIEEGKEEEEVLAEEKES